MHEIKTICREFTAVGREKGLHRDEKDKYDEEEVRREKQGFHTVETEEESRSGSSEDEANKIGSQHNDRLH